MNHYALKPDEREREIKMMITPTRWPRWPFLPVKRWVDRIQEHGFIYADGTFTVYQHYFMLLQNVPEELAAIPKQHKYKSPEEVLAAGWIVD